MAPNFLNKLVKPASSPSDSRTRSRTVSAAKKPPGIVIGHRPVDAEDVPSDSSGPNFMLIPPSPSMTVNSVGSNSGNENADNGGRNGRNDIDSGHQTLSQIEKSMIDYELTPTPQNQDSFIRPSSSTGNLREVTSASDKSKSPTQHGRFATVGGLSASSPSAAPPSTNKTKISKSSSKNSLRLELADQSATSDGSAGADMLTMTPLVDSPTSSNHPFLQASSSVHEAFNSALLAPRSVDGGDTASIRSAASTKSKKPWGRRSSVVRSSSPSKSPKPKQSSLASAIATSGMVMAQATTPSSEVPHSLLGQVPHAQRSTSMLSRHSKHASIDLPMSQSISGSNSDSGSDDELLDLNEDSIPVTGFAVASSKRNAEFHEQFPVIPEGDYLIEDYGCALQREILVQGRLYISENHVCFHANIFGWTTDLSIPMYDVVALEKKMTAFVIPNAIQVTTRKSKYTFASFLSRDTTFDIIYNIWRLARPADSRDVSQRASLDIPDIQELSMATADKPAILAKPPKVTRCTCGIEGKHYSDIALESVVPGTPEKIHNLIFASGFIKRFMIMDQKLIDLQISDWIPADESGGADSKLLTRNMSYIKPLNASIGPRQTKCELRDEVVHYDRENYISTITTTRTPDVPSGNVFSVKTRTCITWASNASTRILVTTQVEWTGRSFIKGIIEKSCIDGQKQYHAELDQSTRVYIQEHLSEFIPDGMDAAEAEAAQTAEIVADTPIPGVQKSPDEVRKERGQERNQRSLQWAYDTFDGAFKVAKQSADTAFELIGDTWDQSSSAGTIPWFIIAILVVSNIWTLFMVGSREEVGRRKEAMKIEEREKWVQGVVTALWEELTSTRKNNGGGGPVGGGSSSNFPSVVVSHSDWREEVSEINKVLDIVEERVRNLRSSLQSLD